MVGLGLLLRAGGSVLGFAKKNPIKTISVCALVGCGIGLYFVGNRIVDDYNDTKAEIISVQNENSALRSRIENQEEINQEILERMEDVEKARLSLRNRIENSERRIDEYTAALGEMNIDNVSIEEGETQINNLWLRTIDCLERAGGEDECVSYTEQ